MPAVAIAGPLSSFAGSGPIETPFRSCGAGELFERHGIVRMPDKIKRRAVPPIP
jgi:hypothetical protein